MALDTLVSQIAYRARLLERALHDAGPWVMEFAWSEQAKWRSQASKNLLEDGVALYAQFPPMPAKTGEVTLYLRDEPVAVFAADASEHGFKVGWTMRAAVTDESRHS